LLATLEHPNILKVADKFTEKNRHYLVMEYLEGDDLEKTLARTGAPLPEEEVLDIAKQTCRILDYLHSYTPPIIYRDLKPANIIRLKTGKIKLIDFGIARFFNPIVSVTSIGTPAYAPREQVMGHAEPRSDIYALGATLHHLLTNQEPIPFTFPPISTANQNFAKVIEKALADNIEERYASAREMLADLEHLSEPDFQVQGYTPQFMSPQVKIRPVLAVDVKSIDYGTVPQNRGVVVKNFNVTNPAYSTRGERLKGIIETNRAWIKVAPNYFTVDEIGRIQVTVNVSQLTSGEYSGAVVVTSNGGLETIVILITVEAPTLKVTPQAVELGGVNPGQSKEVSLFLVNSNPKSGILHGTITVVQPWCSTHSERFSIQMDQAIPFRIDTANLEHGLDYKGVITIDSNGGKKEVPITLRVLAPMLDVDKNQLEYGVLIRKQRKILPIVIRNNGDGILQCSLRTNQPWLRVKPAEFQTSNVQTVQCLVDTAGFKRSKEPQNYQGQLTINSNDGSKQVDISFQTCPESFWKMIWYAFVVWWKNRKVVF
jgi:serine/threonine protein kinase